MAFDDAALPGALGRVETLAQHYKARLLQEGNLDRLSEMPRPQLRQALEHLVTQMITEEKVIISRAERDQLLALILNESAGYGPLEPLLADPEVTEIAVNGPDEVYVEKDGRLSLTAVRFKDAQHIRHIIDRIIAPIGRRIDESSPMVDARLADGSRVNAVIPPISLSGPVLTIRKFRRDPFTLAELVERQSLCAAMAAFLRAAVQGKLNILISGGTGSGKTTLLSAVAGCIPEGERLIIIEDMAELRLHRRGALYMEARPANVEGRGEITIRHLVRNALRMRPDRIIVGEVRGREALDMLQAMNTGHEGSLTTLHANSPQDAFSRLEAMVIMAGSGLSVNVIREHLVGALDLVVQAERLTDGIRRVVAIAEVVGVSGGQVRVNELFRFCRQGIDTQGRVIGRHVATGERPACLARLQARGIPLDPGIFDPERR